MGFAMLSPSYADSAAYEVSAAECVQVRQSPARMGFAALSPCCEIMRGLLRGGGDARFGLFGAAREGGGHVHLLWRG